MTDETLPEIDEEEILRMTTDIVASFLTHNSVPSDSIPELIRSQYDMSPDEYRRKWGLPSDYPMVAPAYSRKRSAFAKDIGLGRGGRKGK